MDTETEPVKLPPAGVMVGAATVDGAVTVRAKAVVLLTPPPVAVTVTGKLPGGVEPAVCIVKTVEQVGWHDGTEKDCVVPEGSPETAKDTD
jgi:hypothetical protein